MTPQDYAQLDALGLAALIARGEITARESIEMAIARIEALNPAFNAVVATCYDQALAELDAHSGPKGPFHGVPYLIKDLHAPVRGLALTHGSRLFAGNQSDFDSETVRRLRRAGFVILGRTNSPEFGLNASTEPRFHGATRNPWKPTHSAGGSSGGAGAAVASGMLPATHATDSGGSIRIPASCNGLVGLKPTRGRNPLGPHRGDMSYGLSHEHAVTHTVRDCAAILDVTNGQLAGDPYYTAPPAQPFLSEIGRDPGRLRVAFTTRTFGGEPVDAECRAAVEKAARLCETLGHHVNEDAPRFDPNALINEALLVLKTGLAAIVAAREAELGRKAAPDELERLTWAVVHFGRTVPGMRYVAALAAINREVRRIAGFFADYDVLITPTLARPPVPLGTLSTDTDDEVAFQERMFSYAPFTLPFNATGQPAITLPLHTSAEGLPVGVQFAAPFGADGLLIRLASQIEKAHPWRRLAGPTAP